MTVRTTLLGWILVALVGAGLVCVAHADLYYHPEIVFGLVDIFN